MKVISNRLQAAQPRVVVVTAEFHCKVMVELGTHSITLAKTKVKLINSLMEETTGMATTTTVAMVTNPQRCRHQLQESTDLLEVHHHRHLVMAEEETTGREIMGLLDVSSVGVMAVAVIGGGMVIDGAVAEEIMEEEDARTISDCSSTYLSM